MEMIKLYNLTGGKTYCTVNLLENKLTQLLNICGMKTFLPIII